MDAESDGFDEAIFVDPQGNVTESGHMNLAIITARGVLVVPPSDFSLPGVTAQNMLELASAAITESGSLGYVHSIERRRIPLEEAKSAREAFLTATMDVLVPIISWDGIDIGDGRPGEVSMLLRAMMLADRKPGAGNDLIRIPYNSNK